MAVELHRFDENVLCFECNTNIIAWQKQRRRPYRLLVYSNFKRKTENEKAKTTKRVEEEN